jgi:hypothetical protein
LIPAGNAAQNGVVEKAKRQAPRHSLRLDPNLGRMLKTVAVLRGESITSLAERAIATELVRLKTRKKEARR